VKHRIAAFILAISLSAFATAQSSTGSRSESTPDKHVHEGTVSESIYKNDFFGFSIEVPPGWKVADNARYQKLNEQTRDTAAKQDSELAELGRGNEINAPLLIMGEIKTWMGGKQHRLVQVLSTDLSNRPGTASAEKFLKFTAELNIRKGLPVECVTKPEQAEIGGRTGWKAYFTQQSSIMWYGVNIVTVERDHILQFILTSPDEEGLRSLETLLKTVQFRK
jgi:hypothetical protein